MILRSITLRRANNNSCRSFATFMSQNSVFYAYHLSLQACRGRRRRSRNPRPTWISKWRKRQRRGNLRGITIWPPKPKISVVLRRRTWRNSRNQWVEFERCAIKILSGNEVFRFSGKTYNRVINSDSNLTCRWHCLPKALYSKFFKGFLFHSAITNCRGIII